ncbi:glycosyltransferase family 1 protein [Dyadobacter luteus]|uniref:Glycosyltransferase family 1 protein n=1 Tax=Dyadobacter luteus TaxID=2259619 RepID=A0A3D8Y491_9BACT|nr:glycosyltransferase [Dyadobacter luteus]REA57054.1 glycosyltransferase family 1 protein [Dyadobacter luteus]
MKLNGENIIVFGLPRIDSEIESTNYTTARLLARYNKVYYVENPLTIKDYWRLRGSEQISKRKGYLSVFSTNLMTSDNSGLWHVIPSVLLSINFLPEGWLFRTLLRLNESLLAFKLKRIFRKHKIDSFIFVNSYNFHYPGLAGHLKPALQVYHSLDPLILPFDRKHGLISEDIIVKKSDVVICSSRQLFRDKKQLNEATYFVPNAADLKHSSKVLDPSLKIHPLLAQLNGPVIGYFGAIERRIDYQLLGAVAHMHSDKIFALVGPVHQEFVPEWFKSLDNVLLTGPVPYAEMPSVIKRFDVALIPFRNDEVSRTIFPLKLFEYLGAGKAVVSTDFNPDLAEFTGEIVPYCSDAESFADAISQALENNSEELLAERLRIAALNTWERRVDEIADIIFRKMEN